MQAIHNSRTEYYGSYLPDLEARKQRTRDAEAQRRAEDMARIERDVRAGQHGTVGPLLGDDGDEGDAGGS